jgi:hypothetical protein
MIEEPVAKRSEKRMKPNCAEHQSTISSAKRERCTAQIEAERLRGLLPIDREGGAGERRRAERRFVQPLAAIGEARAVAREHLDIGEEVMAEGDGLRTLQMREAGHHGVEIGVGLRRERGLQRTELSIHRVDRVAHEEAEVGRHLVVPRARGVESSGRLADDLLQPRLDVHVDVFERARKREAASLDL